MAVVTQATYESLSEKIGNAYSAMEAAIPYIASGLAEVLVLDDADQEYDLLGSWYDANASSSTIFSNTANFTALASTLNTHAELRSGSALATWLTAQGITVTADFAVVSKAAGWDVDAYIA